MSAAHTGKKSFKCELCPAKFSSAKRLGRHRYVHQDERPHQCPNCTKQFKQRRELSRHMKLVHAQNRQKFKCSTCKKTFFRSGCLKRHNLIHRRDEDKFGCYFCKKAFSQQSTLESHIRTHTTEMPFVCRVESCNYSSSYPTNLLKHQRVRHFSAEMRPQPKIWSCYFCSKSFAVFQSLLNHLRLHTFEIPFNCGLCQKRFISQQRLKHHISLHTMEKPFSCEECKKSFTYRFDFNRHIASVHRKEKHFFCKLCKYSSFKKGNLNRHNLVHRANNL